MNLEELKKTQENINKLHANLSDPAWIHAQLNQLKGKFDILTEVINSLEKEDDATSKSDE